MLDGQTQIEIERVVVHLHLKDPRRGRTSGASMAESDRMEGDDAIEELAARVRLALTQTGLFVSDPVSSPKSESIYMAVSTRKVGKRLGTIRVSDHPPKSAKARWRYLSPGGNWAGVVIEFAKRARLTPPPAVFREDERWKSNTGRRPSSRGRPSNR